MSKADQILPPNQQTVFKQVVKMYETKQHKKSLKLAESILKKHPNHGETLAMKGLALNSLDRKKEAYDLVRLGLRYNMMSHICWHVYGLLFRSDRDYKQALNCYAQALKRDKDNMQILRELANLQIQTRDLQGFCESRRTLLSANPKVRANWLCFAVASHLAGDAKNAKAVLESYETTMEKVDKADYDYSEMLLYKNLLIAEAGDLEGALKNLEEIESRVMDKITWMEYKAKYLSQLGRRDEAEQAFIALLDTNSENYNYHQGLMQALGLPFPLYGKAARNAPPPSYSPSDCKAVLAQYETLRAKYPKSAACRRVPLDMLHGADLVPEVDKFLRPQLRKGVPSLFSIIQSLYRHPDNGPVLEKLLVSYVSQLKKDLTLPRLGSDEQTVESPSVLLWALHLLAQHYSQVGKHSDAIAAIDDAIQHTPTVIDCYLVKAKIYKKAGDYARASDLCEEARKMDLADRYLNTISVKAALKANRIELADSVVALFTKDGDNPNNLYDMQASWYEWRHGYASLRRAQYGPALKKLTAIDKHFGDFVEDQFDFHSYCMRKSTVRTYLELLKFEDSLYGHRFYVKAALGIAKTYLAIHDKPADDDKNGNDAEFAGLDEDARKKAIAKKRKEEARAAFRAASLKAEQERIKKNPSKKIVIDNDPDGEELAKAADPLGKAVEYLNKLNEFAGSNLEVHLVACDVWTRRNKPLRVLQSLLRAVKVSDASNPKIFLRLVRFLNLVAANRASLPAPVASVIDPLLVSSFAGLPVAQGARAVIDKFASQASSSLADRFAIAQAKLESGVAAAEAAKPLTASDTGLGTDFDLAFDATKWLRTSVGHDAADALFARCQQHFPYSNLFHPIAAAAEAAE